MSVLAEIRSRAERSSAPFLESGSSKYFLSDLLTKGTAIGDIKPGDVVAVIDDFNPRSIADILALADRNAIVMPLSPATRMQHGYFLEQGHADWVIENGACTRAPKTARHPLIDELTRENKAGLILFSTGTTGAPKAILHDLTRFMARYLTPRPAYRTLAFLMFDHIGGINTILHTIFNGGTVVTPRTRSTNDVLDDIISHDIELLPTSPTFLRLLYLDGLLPRLASSKVKLITYGTEKMDEPTLRALADNLPAIDIRQTYGTTELGILRVKTKARDSLWIQIGGEGVTTRIENNTLMIRAEQRMIGYLNAPSPFDADGWYNTGDVVESDGDWIKIAGRASTVINVGGEKILPSVIEDAAMKYPGIAFAKAIGKPNPLTGQHIELIVQTADATFTKAALLTHLSTELPRRFIPVRITVSELAHNHRFKRN